MANNRAVNGVVWSAIERFSVQGVQFVVSIILARLLQPSDFGLVAIVLVFSTIFLTINESGFNVALMHKLDRDDVDYSTSFFVNLGFGFASYFVLYWLSPFIASFYDSPQLISITRILSLTIIINAFGLVQSAQYTIRVDFKTLARASLTAAIFSGVVGVLYAFLYHNVYAIVTQQICYNLVYVYSMWLNSKWRPSFVFSFERFKQLFSFAYKLIAARLISVIFDDIYSLAIGKLYSPSTLGFYNRAMSFRTILSRNIIQIVQRVSTPMLCEVQKDKMRMQNLLLQFIRNTAFIVYPLLAGLMVLSSPLIYVLLGEKWLETSTMLIYGCPVGFFYLISTFNRNVFNATGRTDWALKSEIFKKIIFVLIFLLTMKYDIEILLLGLILISILEMLVDTSFTYKQIDLSLLAQLKSLVGIVLATLVMAIIVYFSTFLFNSYLLQLIFGTIIGIFTYTVTCYIFNICNFKKELSSHVRKIIK